MQVIHSKICKNYRSTGGKCMRFLHKYTRTAEALIVNACDSLTNIREIRSGGGKTGDSHTNTQEGKGALVVNTRNQLTNIQHVQEHWFQTLLNILFSESHISVWSIVTEVSLLLNQVYFIGAIFRKLLFPSSQLIEMCNFTFSQLGAQWPSASMESQNMDRNQSLRCQMYF